MTPATNEQILAVATPRICAEESCRLTAYQDSLGVWTIGWGRADAGVTEGMTCTQAQADAWRDTKLQGLCAMLDVRLPWWRGLGAVRASVLLQMAYQLGVGGVLGFPKMLAAAQAGNFVEAADDMLDSLWDRQTPARAAREAEQMRTGVSP